MNQTKRSHLAANIQQKIKNVLHALEYCGVCLESTTDLFSVNMESEIVLNGKTANMLLKDILADVFQNNNNIPIGSNICKQCIGQATKAYSFIHDTRDSINLIQEYMNEVYSETDKLLVQIKKLPKHEKTKVIIILENKSNINQGNSEIYSEYNVTATEKDQIIKDSADVIKMDIEIFPISMKGSNYEPMTNGKIDGDNLKTNGSDISKHQVECSQCHTNPCIHYKYLISFTEQKVFVDDVKCLDCDFTCNCKEVLVVHANRTHLNHHPFTCDDCGTQFYSKHSMKRHITYLHREKLTCEYCDRDFVYSATFEDHVQSCKVITREFMCAKCAASFETSDELYNHTKLKHSTENFPCHLCKTKCLTEDNLRVHQLKSHSKVERLRKPQPFLCGYCEKVFESRKECLAHRKTHNPNDKYICKLCNKEFRHIKYLQWHNRIHKQKKSSNPEQCKLCGKNVKALRAHMRLHRLQNSPLIFVCEHCGDVFVSKTKLDSHYLKHSDGTPCTICAKLVKPENMASHNRKHDQTEQFNSRQNKKFVCNICGHPTSSQEMLEGHMNRYHLKIKPYKCEICETSFCAKYHLSQHMKVHSGDLTYSCEICNKKYRYKIGLQKHMYTHTGEKPYMCDICGEGFTGSSYLKEHKLKHFDKSISCPLCDTMFYALKNMRLHFRQQHWKDRKGEYDPKAILNEEYHYLFEDGRKIKFD